MTNSIFISDGDSLFLSQNARAMLTTSPYHFSVNEILFNTVGALFTKAYKRAVIFSLRTRFVTKASVLPWAEFGDGLSTGFPQLSSTSLRRRVCALEKLTFYGLSSSYY